MVSDANILGTGSITTGYGSIGGAGASSTFFDGNPGGNGQNYLKSFGGSGGGGGSSGFDGSGGVGGSTLVAGGTPQGGETSGSAGSTPSPPSLDNPTILKWWSFGIPNFTIGGGGGGGGSGEDSHFGTSGEPGAYGLYIQGFKVTIPNINAFGAAGSGAGNNGGEYGGGGGGGGAGGFVVESYNVSFSSSVSTSGGGGGNGGSGSSGSAGSGGSGGNGGAGALQSIAPPIWTFGLAVNVSNTIPEPHQTQSRYWE